MALRLAVLGALTFSRMGTPCGANRSRRSRLPAVTAVLASVLRTLIVGYRVPLGGVDLPGTTCDLPQDLFFVLRRVNGFFFLLTFVATRFFADDITLARFFSTFVAMCRDFSGGDVERADRLPRGGGGTLPR